MENKKVTALFYGVSGAGKGTQADLLTKYLELESPHQGRTLYIETGEALRGFVRVDGYTNNIAKEYMDRGRLLPAFLPIYIWTSILSDQFSGEEHLVLDGLARREPEAPILDGALSFYGRGDYDVFVLEISDEDAAERLRSRGRSDDDGNEEGIQNKIKWYHDNVEPCIEAIGKLGRRVHRIDGSRSIEEIHEEILKILNI